MKTYLDYKIIEKKVKYFFSKTQKKIKFYLFLLKIINIKKNKIKFHAIPVIFKFEVQHLGGFLKNLLRFQSIDIFSRC